MARYVRMRCNQGDDKRLRRQIVKRREANGALEFAGAHRKEIMNLGAQATPPKDSFALCLRLASADRRSKELSGRNPNSSLDLRAVRLTYSTMGQA